MPPRIGSIPTCMTLSTPNEGCRVPIPADDSIGKPLLEDLHIIRVLPLQRSPLDNALHRLSHIKPGTCIRRREEKNAMLSAPLHQAVAFMPCEIVPD